MKEPCDNESKRFNKLSVRLIGAQDISLARYSYCLVDSLQTESESEGDILCRLGLGKIIQYLRNAGELFNIVHVNSTGEISQLDELCRLYHNLLVLFFPTSVNVSVWTVAYALPYHEVGYGFLSLQAKESKHAGLKCELSMSNRSQADDINGK